MTDQLRLNFKSFDCRLAGRHQWLFVSYCLVACNLPEAQQTELMGQKRDLCAFLSLVPRHTSPSIKTVHSAVVCT